MQNTITNFSIGLKAMIINDKGKILIIKRAANIGKGGLYDFPGGRMNLGETLRTALAREVFEEVGLKVDKVLAPIAVTTFIRNNDHSNQIVRITFPCLASGNIHIGENEVAQYKWIKQKDYINYEFIDENFTLAFSRAVNLDINGASDFIEGGALQSSMQYLH
jgi:8-oxo-dGTP diphosphatase